MLAVVGLTLIVTGMVLLTWRRTSEKAKHPKAAILYGVLTGVSIATYSVWDKFAVAQAEVPPLVLESFTGLGVSLMLTPVAIKRWDKVKVMWREHRTEAIGVAILAPLSYLLILTAMSFTPLSYVAPCREISILFAAVFGDYGADSEERGVFKSTDGGDTWEKVLYRDAKTGAVDLVIGRPCGRRPAH